MELLINLCYALIMAGFLMVIYLGVRAFLRMQRDYNTVNKDIVHTAVMLSAGKPIRYFKEYNNA